MKTKQEIYELVKTMVKYFVKGAGAVGVILGVVAVFVAIPVVVIVPVTIGVGLAVSYLGVRDTRRQREIQEARQLELEQRDQEMQVEHVEVIKTTNRSKNGTEDIVELRYSGEGLQPQALTGSALAALRSRMNPSFKNSATFFSFGKRSQNRAVAANAPIIGDVEVMVPRQGSLQR